MCWPPLNPDDSEPITQIHIKLNCNEYHKVEEHGTKTIYNRATNVAKEAKEGFLREGMIELISERQGWGEWGGREDEVREKDTKRDTGFEHIIFNLEGCTDVV